jgi:SAM-dependent methyltransferase
MPGNLLSIARKAAALLRPGSFAMHLGRCPSCGPTLLVKLADDPISVRCVRCRSSAIHMSILQVLPRVCPDLPELSVYEMSSRGPLFEFLGLRAGKLMFSEFYDDVDPGTFKEGVQCQDVQQLTFDDASFDLCTSTEVFEHVPDDRRGFAEIRRVLRPGGRFVFTVPLTADASTVERAALVDGELRHLLEPEYHGDVIRGQGKVLCFRNYGLDILDRLRESGFRSARFESPDRSSWWGFGTEVVVAEV